MSYLFLALALSAGVIKGYCGKRQAVFFGEKLTAKCIGGMVIAFAGLLIINL